MKINFLHISDLHVGLTDQEHLWPNVEREFLRDIRDFISSQGPLDFIFFTGDLTQAGQDGEFQRLSSILDHIWNTFSDSDSKPTLLAVPGNHDLARPSSTKNKPVNPSLRILLRWHDFPEVHSELWMPGNEYQSLINQLFENYSKWSLDILPRYQNPACITKRGILPGDFATSLTIGEKRIGIIGLNTAFLQLEQGNYIGRLSAYMQQIQAVCGNIPAWEMSHHITFLLTHHPVDWLHPNIQNLQWAEISPAGRFDFHLFGHMHENRSREESIDGGAIRRTWQGSSLFGTEHFLSSDGTKKIVREHGFQFGQILIDSSNESTLRQFPRKAFFHEVNGWRIINDPRFGQMSTDGGTVPRSIKLRDASPDLIANSETKHSPTTARANQVSDALLRGYVEIINRDHGFIRFVEIPHLQDVSDIAISQLFTSPEVSTQQIYCDWPEDRWGPRQDVLEMLSANNKVVILGDPGYGKSTLISYLSWFICNFSRIELDVAKQNQSLTKLGNVLKNCVPIPIVLREMQLQTDLTWESLIDSFVEHQALGRHLKKRENVDLLLKQGRAVVMFDGIDEISNTTVRNKLRSAVHQGMSAYPSSRWLFTSRIVGYDEVPFDIIFEEEQTQVKSARAMGKKGDRTEPNVARTSANRHRVARKICERYYLTPFSKDKILAFSKNWFARHEGNPAKIQDASIEFNDNVSRNDGTQRLARIPFLLTLMSLLYHKNANLPHGRAELYEKIVTAYLESIDARRRLTRLPYSLNQKKQWLSYIGFQMQSRRLARVSQFGASDILASARSVRAWVEEAIAEVGTHNPKKESKHLLDYFAARSGLFLPRGVNKFAFAHLSLQEYFAASYLEPRLAASRFANKVNVDGPSDEELFEWANKISWRETFALLFEILAERGKGQTEAFLEFLFSQARLSPGSISQHVAVQLLAEVIVDPFNSISVAVRSEMRRRCWTWIFSCTRSMLEYERVESDITLDSAVAAIARTLLTEHNNDLQCAWESAGLSSDALNGLLGLRFDNANLSDLTPIGRAKNLQCLSLEKCGRLTDLQPLKNLGRLRYLNLIGCDSTTDISVLSTLSDLQDLRLSVSADGDALSELQNLQRVRSLKLRCLAGAVNLHPLQGLPQLTNLVLEGVTDLPTLKSLAELPRLTEIHIHGCPLDLDLSFLRSLRNLSFVCKAGSPQLRVPRVFDMR